MSVFIESKIHKAVIAILEAEDAVAMIEECQAELDELGIPDRNGCLQAFADAQISYGDLHTALLNEYYEDASNEE